MPRLLLLFLLLLSFPAFAAQEQNEKPIAHKITATITTTEHKLPNGLTVFLTENPKSPNVRVSHWVRAGSLQEKPGTTGIAHLFEHMMFRPVRPGAPTFFEISTKLGGQLNANTRFE